MTTPTVKAKANSAANMKAVDGNPTTAISLPPNGYVYGDMNPGNTDVMNLRHPETESWGYFRPTGEFVTLSEAYKVSKANLTVDPYVLTPPIDPDPDPTPDPIPQTPVEVKVNIDDSGIVTVTVNGVSYVQP